MSDPVLLYDLRAELAEAPIWSTARARLLFADINRGHVHEFDPVTGEDTITEVGKTVGAIACAADGSLVLATGIGFSRLTEGGDLVHLADAAPGRLDLRMNDGYVDALGRFWAGTMSLTGAIGAGALYRLDPDGVVHTMLQSVTTSNGIDWSPDNRLMYYTDTRTGRVDAFDFDLAAGAISNRRTFVTIAPERGRPDGLVVDVDGGVWVALWAGSRLCRYTTAGVLDVELMLPAKNVTKCAFGGQNLDELYITTAWRGLSPAERQDQPHAGGVFRVRPGIRGKAPNLFLG